MSKKKRRDKIDIPAPKLPDEKIKFSFEFYDTSCKDYCISSWEEEKISATLRSLQDVNRKTYSEISRDKVVYHFHPVAWERTTKKNGFPDRGMKGLESFQFALVGVNGQKARVYGALSLNTFYIVWFDLNHQIWPTLKKHT